jgi:hypothetical protein
VFLLRAGRQPVLWVLDGIFQAGKGAQEPEMGLEIRDIDQRRHLIFADGKSRGELSRILGVRRWRLFAFFRRTCRGLGWETNLANGRHGLGHGPSTRRWQWPLSGPWNGKRKLRKHSQNIVRTVIHVGAKNRGMYTAKSKGWLVAGSLLARCWLVAGSLLARRWQNAESRCSIIYHPPPSRHILTLPHKL